MVCLQSACSALGAPASLCMQRALGRGQQILGNLSASRMVAGSLACAISVLSVFIPAQNRAIRLCWCCILRDVLEH